MYSILVFLAISSVPQYSPEVSLKKFIGKPLKDVIIDLNIDSSSYDFGGGLDDCFLKYCSFEDRNSNSYKIWIETPFVLLPNFLTDKDYIEKRQKIFEDSLEKKVIHISLTCEKPLNKLVHTECKPVYEKGFFPLCLFKGKILSTCIHLEALSDFKIIFDDWNQAVILRIRYPNMNIYEIQIGSDDKELKNKDLSKELTIHDIHKCKIKNVRIFSGDKSTDLEELLFSLDGRLEK
ncbi:MAG: hypothetical protein CR997_01570 [Acidobacteria bacterium]|nr:MAG: hypothetical protein CR997_01570 [Acidobacteriota bacterium]